MISRSERFLSAVVVAGICLAAVAGTGTVFYQTRVANPSVEEYFTFINFGRLLIISHVHLFGYATMGFVLWTLGRRLQVAADRRFGFLLGLAVGAGILDVLSWWGVIFVSPSLRFLTFLCGGGFVGGILLSGLLVLRACARGVGETRAQ